MLAQSDEFPVGYGLCFASAPIFYFYLPCLNGNLAFVKVLTSMHYHKRKALVGAFTGNCETSRSFVDSSTPHTSGSCFNLDWAQRGGHAPMVSRYTVHTSGYTSSKLDLSISMFKCHGWVMGGWGEVDLLRSQH